MYCSSTATSCDVDQYSRSKIAINLKTPSMPLREHLPQLFTAKGRTLYAEYSAINKHNKQVVPSATTEPIAEPARRKRTCHAHLGETLNAKDSSTGAFSPSHPSSDDFVSNVTHSNSLTLLVRKRVASQSYG